MACPQLLSQVQWEHPQKLQPLVQIWPLVAPKSQDGKTVLPNSKHPNSSWQANGWCQGGFLHSVLSVHGCLLLLSDFFRLLFGLLQIISTSASNTSSTIVQVVGDTDVKAADALKRCTEARPSPQQWGRNNRTVINKINKQLVAAVSCWTRTSIAESRTLS